MTEKEYFEFIEQYIQLFSKLQEKREKIVIDPKLTKL